MRTKPHKNASFKDAVLAVVASIPRGKTMSYKEVAEHAGRPRASRAVGTLMAHNYDPAVPCHRVIRSDGTPGNYNRGPAQKIALLRKEGAIL